MLRSRGRQGPSRPRRPAGPSRREILAGGAGAGLLLAVPIMTPATVPGAATDHAATDHAAGGTGSQRRWFAFLYGTPQASPFPGGAVMAARSPAAAAAPPAPFQLASKLAAAPVLSPDGSTVALVTVAPGASGATVTLALTGKATASATKQGSLTLAGVPQNASILATPVFAPGTPTVALVLAITVPATGGTLTKTDPFTGRVTTGTATTWRSEHALAYFDSGTGVFTGPFGLADGPALALTTVAANGTDLFVWTTPEPQAADYSKASPAAAPLSTVSAYPLGSGTPRFSAPSLAPWPGGEPVVTLPGGDVARLVYGRDVQVCSALTGDITTHTLAPLNVARAKPSAITMQTRSDGTVFITKPGIGAAMIVDPANAFQVKSQVSFPVPHAPGGAPWSKAVLSAAGDTLYTVGAASTGGITAYDMSTGALTAAYVQGTRQYAGLSVLPNGNVLAVSPAHPRLTFFSPTLSPLGTADTNLQIAAIF